MQILYFVFKSTVQDTPEPKAQEILQPGAVEEESSDLDGAPLPYDDSMDGESLPEGNSDLDGMPLKDGGMDLDGMPLGVVEDYDGAPSKISDSRQGCILDYSGVRVELYGELWQSDLTQWTRALL